MESALYLAGVFKLLLALQCALGIFNIGIFKCETQLHLCCSKPLSLQTISFGENAHSSTLRRMAEIARDRQRAAPPDPLAPASTIESSYSVALDTVSDALLSLAVITTNLYDDRSNWRTRSLGLQSH